MSKSNEREGSNFRRLEAVVVEKSEAGRRARLTFASSNEKS